jgi:predicted transcriptional regulator
MHFFIYPLWERLSTFVEPSPASHQRGHFFAHELTAQRDSTMPKLTRDHTAVVTVKLRPDDLSKLDAMAVRSHRSRADMIRRLIDAAAFTGQPDVRIDGPAHGGRDAA